MTFLGLVGVLKYVTVGESPCPLASYIFMLSDSVDSINLFFDYLAL